TVLAVPSPDLAFRAVRAHARASARGRPAGAGPLDHLLLPAERGAPLVTVHDAAPQSLSFLAGALGAPLVPLGVDRFGQCGAQADVYAWHGISADDACEAALGALAAR